MLLYVLLTLNANENDNRYKEIIEVLKDNFQGDNKMRHTVWYKISGQWVNHWKELVTVCFAVLLVTEEICSGTVVQHDGFLILQGADTCQIARINGGGKSRVFNNDQLVISRGNAPYRSLIRFDLTSILTNKPVKDVALLLYCCKQHHHTNPMKLKAHALQAAWQPGETTWAQRMTNVSWSTIGGDFDPEPASEFEISGEYGEGWVPLSANGMRELINQWLMNPPSNHGLLLTAAFEYPGQIINCFHFADAPTRDFMPKLIVSFDGQSDLAKQGYISTAELIRRPLRKRLDHLKTAFATSTTTKATQQLQVLAEQIEQVGASDTNKATQLDQKLDRFRNNQIQTHWPNRKFAIWPTGPWQELSPDMAPLQKKATFSVKMLQEEYQELSVAVANLTDKPLTLDAKLHYPTGISADNITLRASYWVKCRPVSKIRGENAPIWIDDVLPRLRENRFIDLAPGQSRRLWMTINSNGLKAGLYETTIKISCEGTQNGQIPVKIEVLPVALQTDPNLHVFTYAYLNRPATTKLKSLAVADMMTHGQNTFVLNLYPEPTLDDDGNLIKPADFEPIRQYLRSLDNPKKVLFFWNWDNPDGVRATFGKKVEFGSPAWRKIFDPWLRQWRDMLIEEGYDRDRFIMYPMDETYDNTIWGCYSEYDALLRVAEEIHRVDPQIKIFADPVLFRKADLAPMAALNKYIDVWSPLQYLYHDGDQIGWPRNYTFDEKLVMQSFFTEQQNKGNLLWTYQCSGPTKALHINSYYRQYAWRAWRHGITGLGFWSYNNINKSSWDDFDAREDFTMIYELRDAPSDIPRTPAEPLIPSRRWQVWRIAIQDYYLLQQVAAISDNSRKLATKLVDRVLADTTNPAVYDEVRHQLIHVLSVNKKRRTKQ